MNEIIWIKCYRSDWPLFIAPAACRYVCSIPLCAGSSYGFARAQMPSLHNFCASDDAHLHSAYASSSRANLLCAQFSVTFLEEKPHIYHRRDAKCIYIISLSTITRTLFQIGQSKRVKVKGTKILFWTVGQKLRFLCWVFSFFCPFFVNFADFLDVMGYGILIISTLSFVSEPE